MLTRTLRSASKVSSDDIREARATAQRRHTKAFTDMARLVNAAKAAGMSR